MRKDDVLDKIPFAEARKDGGHNLYVRARVRCSVGDHIFEKDFTVDEWDDELIKKPAEPWVCLEHCPDYERVFGTGSDNVDVRCSACGKLVSLTAPKNKAIPADFRCKDCQI
jgi:hypothetical protein